VLQLLPSNGGVIMINFGAGFINCTNPSSADVSQVADHIDHVRRVAGIDHVGIGADFEGVGGRLPRNLTDVSMYPNLFAELIRRLRYTDDDIAKILNGNIMRVFKSVEAIASQLQGVESPSEAMIDYNFVAANNTCRNL